MILTRQRAEQGVPAHEVENLYGIDGGPFPTSTGVNPTLTIMANAWRVAEEILAQGSRQ